jgi:oligopeptide/dipeptide ABC transporter ATP-binding protein
MGALLEIENLKTHFFTRDGVVRAVDGVSFSIEPGETLALVGESGSGKSSLARALVGLNPIAAGRARLFGQPITGISRQALRRHRGTLQLIFQDPHASLNPRFTIAQTLAEPLLLHGKASRKDVDAKICELLAQVGLDAELRSRYPHEFSGGQRQRISIARALAVEPKLLLCDEVTSALDVSIQAQILELLRSVQQRLGLAYLFITHDLGVVAELCDRVIVMYAGRVVETGPTAALLQQPLHPYTEALLKSTPRVDQKGGGKLHPIKGLTPRLSDEPLTECAFAPRCPRVRDACRAGEPELVGAQEGRLRRCIAPVAEMLERS